MLAVTTEALRVSRGLVLWVVAGWTRKGCYQPGPELLLAEWWRQGGECWRPCYWHRHGIPGSGGKQWYRADVEYVLAFKRPGELLWADPKANGKPPKYKHNGAPSHRLVNGTRKGRPHTKRATNGQMKTQAYIDPGIANPGVLVRTKTGGGHLGSPLAHENEAPYPQVLPEHFIRSHCPPGGRALDPFSGSATTVAAALALGRHGVGSDLRFSQCELGRRRIGSVNQRFDFA